MSIAYPDDQLDRAFYRGKQDRQQGVPQTENPFYKPRFLHNFMMTPYDMWLVGWRAADQTYPRPAR